MGRRRRKDKHLPERVYLRNGRYYYVPAKGPDAGKWKNVGTSIGEMHRALAVILGPEAPASTIRQLVARYEREGLTKKAAKTQENERHDFKRLLPFFGEMLPEDVESHEVWDYFVKRGEGPQARHEVRTFSSIMTFARRIGARTKENPCLKLRLPGAAARDRYVTDGEFWAVHDVASPMIAGAMRLALLAGMDGATIRMLERRHVTDEGLRFIRPKTARKGVQEQLIEWSEELHETVRAILALPPQVRRFLISDRHGHPYTAAAFQQAWQRSMQAGVKKGVKRYTFHDLRAKSASEDRKSVV